MKKTLITVTGMIFLVFNPILSAKALEGISFLKHNSETLDKLISTTLDSENAFIMSGISEEGAEKQYLTIKCNPSLRYVVGYATSTVPKKPSGPIVSTDKSNNIIVAYSGSDGIIAEKYSPRLKKLTDRQLTGDTRDKLVDSVTMDDDNTFILHSGLEGKQAVFTVLKVNSYLYPLGSFTKKIAGFTPLSLSIGSGDNLYISAYSEKEGALLIKLSSNLTELSSVKYSFSGELETLTASYSSKDEFFLAASLKDKNETRLHLARFNPDLVLLSSTTVATDIRASLSAMTSDKLGNFLILTEKKNQKQSGTVAISAFSKDFKFINENIFESTSLYDLVGGIDVDQENNILVGLTRVAREYGEPDTSDIMALKLKGFTLPPQIKVPETGEVRIIGGGEEDPLNTLKGDKAVISYRITSPGEVDLIVYNQMGDPVWQNKFDSEDTEGTLEWRGRSKEGVLLPPGSYIMHFRAPGINTTRSIRVIN